MKHPPSFVVVIAHMSGPLKGQIQQFSQSEITIGRHPSCHVRFPASLTTISRSHAKIIREGNRFKLIDESANGTLVNGRKVTEIWLKDGDVLTITQGGPQVGFITEISDSPREPEDVRQPTLPTVEPLQPVSAPTVTTPPPAQPAPPQITPGAKVKVSLVIQYGPTIRSFRELPVNIGKSPRCECQLDHALILDEHAQIFFFENNYWIKDLTGQNQVCRNGKPVETQIVLRTNDELALTESGPFFKFLGGGRLAEVEKIPEEEL
jgi:pSer/pThr/pTyr-binding forkhead associated (FHA) protein